MAMIELFPHDQVVGIFRGFREGGLEFHADLVLPYRNDFQRLPMHGQFLLVQLETPNEAVLGRIASFSAEGKLSSGYGEEFNLRAVRENRPIPDDLREEYLKYKVNIRVLGVVRNNVNGSLTFVASHRRLPHVGSHVAFPSESVLQEIVGHNIEGATIGHFALGEYIYARGSGDLMVEDWMQVKSPEVLVKFPVSSLVSRRSFIFARAGFGKSNLNKLLFSKLYEQTPTVPKRGGKQIPVGTIIFDPDGEYFWPDVKGRPGLCDVPELEDKLVVFTSRKNPSPFYQSFVAGGIKLDIRRLSPADVIAISLSPDRQEQQNVRKLRGLDQGRWEKLVNLIDQNRNQTPLDEIGDILGLEKQQDAEALAARANMTAIVHMLHDKSSQLMDMLLTALSEGKLCVIDVSQMRGSQSLILSGLILRRIFDHNQDEFTKAEPRTIPTIAVVEEAQSVLSEKAAASEPYIAWVKEGRKYDLGALLITQQPGSIPVDILSQGDNWFIFHLLSSTDLTNVRKANAHFSEDILSVLLNEPIPGQGVFWSSVGGKPYPVSIRVLSFESMYPMIDPSYIRGAANTFASKLRAQNEALLKQALEYASSSLFEEEEMTAVDPLATNQANSEKVDVLEIYKRRAIDALKTDTATLQKMRSSEGVSFGHIVGLLEKHFPDEFQDLNKIAYTTVPQALTEIFGRQGDGWHSYRNAQKNNQVYVRGGRG